MSSRAHDPSDPVLPRDAGQPERRRTLLQDGTVLRGDFSSDGIVELGGKITGDLTVDTLVLARSGQAEGTIRARNVTIEGTLLGTIEAQSVVIKTSAKVRADITCQTLCIDPGADIEGHLSCKAVGEVV